MTGDDETTVYPVVVPPRPPIEPPLVAGPGVPVQFLPRAMPPLVAGPGAPGQFLPRAMPPLYPVSPQSVQVTVGRVVFAAVVLLVFGAVEAFGGTLGAVFAGSLRRVFDQALRGEGVRIEPTAVLSVVTGFFVVLLLLGVLHVAAAIGVLAHRTWGRVLGVMFATLGTASSALLLVRAIEPHAGRVSSVVAVLAVFVPYLITFLALLFAGDHFRQHHRRR
jgi:hypothetical protein